MANVVQIALSLSYVILALAVALGGPAYLGMQQNLALGLGLLVYVLLSQGTRLYVSGAEQKAANQKAEELEFNLFKLDAKVDEAIERMEAAQDNSKMVEELKMLQTLLIQFVKKEKQISGKPAKGEKAPAKDKALSKAASAPAGVQREQDPQPEADMKTPEGQIKGLPDQSFSESDEEIIELSESEIFDDEMSGGRGDVRDAPVTIGGLDDMVGRPGDADAKGTGSDKRKIKKRKIRLIKKESQLLDVMRSGLSENRVDLYLQPIVGLPSRKAVFFECFSRVRDEDGNIILPRHYMQLAENAGLSGTLDNLLLFRLIQLIRKMGKRKQNLKFFCNLSLSSLEDKEFFPQFVDYMTMNEEFSHRLVFELTKSDYAALPDDVLAMMAQMGRKGFAFSLDQVDTIDLDVKDLRQKFIKFVKIDSKILETEFQESELVDYIGYLRRHEIALIASRVEREAMVLHALDNNVEFAQGYLFSEPVAASEMDSIL